LHQKLKKNDTDSIFMDLNGRKWEVGFIIKATDNYPVSGIND
jgi:hypothetical protein